MTPLRIYRLGEVPYADALDRQTELVASRRAGTMPDTLLLLEHPPVLTLGVRGDGGRAHILAGPDDLASRGIGIFETGRGGRSEEHTSEL